MAHLRDIHVRECCAPGCPKKATVMLVNTRNAQLGDYCKRHGEQAEKKLTAQERAGT